MNTHEKPFISIALCTYNGEKFLEEQLDSLIQQDYRPIEIIAVDDFSSDGSFEILQKYKQHFPYFNIFRNPENLGFLKNFEKSLSLCKGEYIAFCDQDDIWQPNKLSLQIENIGSNGLIYHDSELIDESGTSLSIKISDLINMYEGNSPLPFLLRNCVSGHAILIHRKIVEDILPFQIGYHDWWTAYVAANTTGIKYLDSCLVKYRQHGDSATKILKQSQENSYYPPLDYFKIFNSYSKNNNPKLINNLYALWRAYETCNFSFSEFISLLKNYKLFFFISKTSDKEKLNFVTKLLRKKIKRLFRKN